MSRSLLPNSTQIPDVILDEWLPLLSGAELAVVLFVARKTYGWGKSFDRISLSQMQEGTGLVRSTVAKTCDILAQKGVLETRQGTGRTPTAYRLNLACDLSHCTENRTSDYTENRYSNDYTENHTSTKIGTLTVPKIGTLRNATVPKIELVTVPKIEPTRNTIRNSIPYSPHDEMLASENDATASLLKNDVVVDVEKQQEPNASRSETQMPKEKPSAKKDKADYDPEGFKAFFDLYGRKVGRQAAQEAWSKLRPDASLQEAMCSAAAAMKRVPGWDREEKRFVPHPATWINQRRWEDEIEGLPPEPSPPPVYRTFDREKYEAEQAKKPPPRALPPNPYAPRPAPPQTHHTQITHADRKEMTHD